MDGILGQIAKVIANVFIRRGVKSAIDSTMGTGKPARTGNLDRESREAERSARQAAKQARQAAKLTRKM